MASAWMMMAMMVMGHVRTFSGGGIL